MSPNAYLAGLTNHQRKLRAKKLKRERERIKRMLERGKLSKIISPKTAEQKRQLRKMAR